MKIKGLDHIVFIVDSLQDAAATWKGTLGLTVGEQLESIGLQGVLGLLPVGEPDAASGFIELAQPAGSEGPLAEMLAERGEGMLSISIEVDDIDAAVAELKSKGIEIADVVQGPLPDSRVARLAPGATHGVRLQLIERNS
ncbi:MAG: VOC family protein [Chloroflexi bacterium]|nr:VOC family protein [Chloroflexota bacterium]MCH8009870.1 VOC family protein [Chloroflexota bacterium]